MNMKNLRERLEEAPMSVRVRFINFVNDLSEELRENDRARADVPETSEDLKNEEFLQEPAYIFENTRKNISDFYIGYDAFVIATSVSSPDSDWVSPESPEYDPALHGHIMFVRIPGSDIKVIKSVSDEDISEQLEYAVEVFEELTEDEQLAEDLLLRNVFYGLIYDKKRRTFNYIRSTSNEKTE